MSDQRAGRGVAWLRDLTRADAAIVGAKAATLGDLLRAGFPVPDGFAVTGDAGDEVVRAAAALGEVPLAVRSSGLAEDLPDASFAGQYETVLDVRGEEALRAAVRRCRESAAADRVERYREARTGAGESRMAVLVQRMVAAEAAGVAFTANPLTGDRDEVVITAAAGPGERVVGGEATGDEWVVRGAAATCRRSTERAIDAGQAAAVASLARRAAEHLGGPQDVEWALAGGELHLLQARPITALPEPVAWTPPFPGYWMRNFRLGEWLPEPMTPLFEDWLLELIEEGYLDGMRRTLGTRVAFRHAAVNGWYYTTAPRVSPALLLRVLRESRGRVVPFLYRALVRVGARPEVADRTVLRALAGEWRDVLLPGYRDLVAEGERRAAGAGPQTLAALIDEVGRMAGRYLWSLAVVGGSAWKMEGALGRFCREHVPEAVAGGAQVLLAGLPGAEPELLPHLVQSADWYHATLGEMGAPGHAAGPRERAGPALERERAEARCRAGLARSPGLLARFETLLEVAQRYAVLRERQARMFTLGWPLLRRCALGLGEGLRERGVVERAEDVFFLRRSELDARAPAGDLVDARRAQWKRRRRLVAPLAIGTAPRILRRALAGAADAAGGGPARPPGALVGEPASPGRASGPVRIVRGPDDFARFEPGDVLVARGTSPAWTPLFARAAAVVTDGGSLAAHASLVAREYGIPAVVGTGDATARLGDGQLVTVDGGAGTVESLTSREG